MLLLAGSRHEFPKLFHPRLGSDERRAQYNGAICSTRTHTPPHTHTHTYIYVYSIIVLYTGLPEREAYERVAAKREFRINLRGRSGNR